MSPGFVLGWENVPCVAEVVNRSLKADCTDFTSRFIFPPIIMAGMRHTVMWITIIDYQLVTSE